MNRKILKEGSNHTFQVQESSPDVGYSPFGQTQDWKAYNRFTVTMKAKLFSDCRMSVGLKHTLKKFGSIIEFNCTELMFMQDVTNVTVTLRRSCNIRTIMEAMNLLRGATKAQCAFMKINAHLRRQSRRMELNEAVKYLREVYANLNAPLKTKTGNMCVWCSADVDASEEKTLTCSCGYKLMMARGNWDPEL